MINEEGRVVFLKGTPELHFLCRSEKRKISTNIRVIVQRANVYIESYGKCYFVFPWHSFWFMS